MWDSANPKFLAKTSRGSWYPPQIGKWCPVVELPSTNQQRVRLMSEKAPWITYRPELKVLDCTIRDGGLINNHLFSFNDSSISHIYRYCVNDQRRMHQVPERMLNRSFFRRDNQLLPTQQSTFDFHRFTPSFKGRAMWAQGLRDGESFTTMNVWYSTKHS